MVHSPPAQAVSASDIPRRAHHTVVSGGVERLEALRLEAAGRDRDGWSYRLRVDAGGGGVLRVAAVLKHGYITALASFERGGAGIVVVRYWTNSPDMPGEHGAEVPAGRVADVLDLAGLLKRLAEEGLPSAALFVAHRALEELGAA